MLFEIFGKGVRNFVKLIIISLLNVHSELFLLNKSLIKVVFTYAVREIYNKLLVLFTNIPQFGSHPAVQTYIDVFCLREVFKVYTVDESKELIAKIEQFVAAYNKTKAPFSWTATAGSILEKLQRLCSQISGTTH